MTSLIANLLQVALALVLSVQTNPALTKEQKLDALASASHAVQLAALALDPLQPIVVNNYGYADLGQNDLQNAELRDLDGQVIRLRAGGYSYPDGRQAKLMENLTSFGDLNRDNADDAVLIIKMNGGGRADKYLAAAVLNGNGVTRAGGSAELKDAVTIQSHHVEAAEFQIYYDRQDGGSIFRRFKLKGGALAEI